MYLQLLKKSFLYLSTFVCLLCNPQELMASTHVGLAQKELTPPIGTPSAGYQKRMGKGMEGVHDPLLVQALVVTNGSKQVVFCSVDHLGFTHVMVENILQRIRQSPLLEQCELFLGSSHTHSGGGAFLDIPLIGEAIAGRYDPAVTRFYENRVIETILEAATHLQEAEVGIGYGNAENLSIYRSSWPLTVQPLSDVAVIKITAPDGSPIAVLFNYPMHPTVLKSNNRLFSADFVGYARSHLKSLLGENVMALYFNGAQGDISPRQRDEEDPFEQCQAIGMSLADTVVAIWNSTNTQREFDIRTASIDYSFAPSATPFGLKLPLAKYESQISLIVLNKFHAFVAIPGELSTVYDRRFKTKGNELHFSHVSILGLVNDAHGYIISPESWSKATFESQKSFGGQDYGQRIECMVYDLMQQLAPN